MEPFAYGKCDGIFSRFDSIYERDSQPDRHQDISYSCDKCGFFRGSVCRLCPSVRLSVRLAVCHVRVLCQNEQSYLQTFFHRRVAAHWFFCTKRSQYSDEDPANGGGECRWMKKIRPISRFISEMIQDRALFTMGFEWGTVPKLSNDTIFNDLE